MEEVKETIPTFTQFVNENYPAGAEQDPNAPWRKTQPAEWSVSDVNYNQEDGDIVFYIKGAGYPAEVKIWSGDDEVVDRIDRALDMSEDEFETKLGEFVATMKADHSTIPPALYNKIESELREKYEKYEPSDI